jgi:hypothetical protein
MTGVADTADPYCGMQFIKLASGSAAEDPHIWGDVFVRVPMNDGNERLQIGVSRAQVALIKLLAAELEPLYHMLYVLIVRREGERAGRYQLTPSLDLEQLSAFFDRYGTVFEQDGRHAIWVQSGSGQLVFTPTTSSTRTARLRHSAPCCFGTLWRSPSRFPPRMHTTTISNSIRSCGICLPVTNGSIIRFKTWTTRRSPKGLGGRFNVKFAARRRFSVRSAILLAVEQRAGIAGERSAAVYRFYGDQAKGEDRYNGAHSYTFRCI